MSDGAERYVIAFVDGSTATVDATAQELAEILRSVNAGATLVRAGTAVVNFANVMWMAAGR